MNFRNHDGASCHERLAPPIAGAFFFIIYENNTANEPSTYRRILRTYVQILL